MQSCAILYCSLDNYRFMRSVAYRKFIHLVYDQVGKNRIPLPACAYHAIRSKFQPKDSNEHFVGFQEEEEMADKQYQIIFVNHNLFF